MSGDRRTSLEDVFTVLHLYVSENFPDDAPGDFDLTLRSGKHVTMPVPTRRPADAPLRYSDDFRTIWLTNRQYDFTEDQAHAAGLLVRALEDGTRDVSAASLLEAGESGCSRVRDLFRSCAAWQDGLIVSGEKIRTFRLLWPDEVQ